MILQPSQREIVAISNNNKKKTCSKTTRYPEVIAWACLVSRPHFCARPMCFGSRGARNFSPKCIDWEGLGRRRTGTRQGLGSVHTNPDIFETAYFFTRIGHQSIRNQWIRTPTPHYFDTALQSRSRPRPHDESGSKVSGFKLISTFVLTWP